jgi:hypothetical protein
MDLYLHLPKLLNQVQKDKFTLLLLVGISYNAGTFPRAFITIMNVSDRDVN